MNESMGDQLRKLCSYPKVGEVWLIKDDEVMMDVPVPARKEIKIRPLLIISHPALCTKNSHIINGVPLTTQGNPDLLRFPITPDCYNYKNQSVNYTFKQNSFALLYLYQPLYPNLLTERIGSLSSEMTEAIRNCLGQHLLGYGIDLDIDIE